MIRKEVMSLAGKLSSVSGLDQDHIYSWLMDVGLMNGKNPTLLKYAATNGRIVCLDDDGSFLERYLPANIDEMCGIDDGPDYEDLILARQEAWMD